MLIIRMYIPYHFIMVVCLAATCSSQSTPLDDTTGSNTDLSTSSNAPTATLLPTAEQTTENLANTTASPRNATDKEEHETLTQKIMVGAVGGVVRLAMVGLIFWGFLRQCMDHGKVPDWDMEQEITKDLYRVYTNPTMDVKRELELEKGQPIVATEIKPSPTSNGKHTSENDGPDELDMVTIKL